MLYWLIDWLIDGRVVKVLNPAETHTVVLSAEETGIFIKLEKKENVRSKYLYLYIYIYKGIL